ncbi:DoxX family protein [Streptomyces sp. NRRL F-2664]|uniref:DoxX family protein n=1 Tax=Streptomyces sp. NRRL F-2664 TaxID=1463842 RepID=UPI00068F7933|nr:DoxX family protein [Streptomyces sp. NRRL F-2664]
MALLRKLARPLLAAPFITAGLHTVRRPDTASADLVQSVVRAVADRIPTHPTTVPDRIPADRTPPADRISVSDRLPALATADPRQLLRATGALQATAGLLLATGRAPRLAAVTLAATLVPTSLAAHAFWTEDDPEERARQRTHFLTDLSALGGLLITAADTHGKPSLAYRSRHAVRAAATASRASTLRRGLGTPRR